MNSKSNRLGKSMHSDYALGKWIKENPGCSFGIFVDGKMRYYKETEPVQPDNFISIDEFQKIFPVRDESRD